MCRGEDEVALTEQEAALLGYFLANPNADLSRTQLLEDVLGYASGVRSRAVDDAVKRLRKKIEQNPARPFHLIGVRGVGYRFVPIQAATLPTETLVLPDRSVDLARLEVCGPGDVTVSLSAQEGRLLEVLAQRPGQVVDQQTLLWSIWGTRSLARRRVLDSLVYRLRGKLEANLQEPTVLRTVRGKGLCLELHNRPPGPARGGTPCRPPLSTPLDRDVLCAAVRARLDGGARLVTLHGPAGAGKTTLARLVGAQDATNARFVDLSSVAGAEGVQRAVAEALHLDRPELIAPAAKEWPELLLILDNAESALDGVRDRVGAWLEAGAARFLITSRLPLRLTQEQRVSLPPLSPDAAKALFERQLSTHGGSLSEADRGALPALLAALDHLPLAIEMAAARSRLLGVKRLHARLSRSLSDLKNPAVDAPARHRSMEAAVMLSWTALSEPQRAFLCDCQVFSGGFALDDAEAVLGEDSLELIEALSDAAVVQLLPGDGEARFAPYAVVRHIASGARAPSRAVRRNYIAWAAGLAGVMQPGDRLPLARMPGLLPHITDALSAYQAALGDDQPEDAVRILMWLAPVLTNRGTPTIALEALGAMEPFSSQLAPRARWWLEFLQLTARQSTLPISTLISHSRAHADIAEANGWKALAIQALCATASGYTADHLLDDAEATLDRADALMTPEASTEARLRLLYARAFWMRGHGRQTEGREAMLHALGLARRSKADWWSAFLARTLGWLALLDGHLAEAEAWLGSALEILEPSGEVTLRDDALSILGSVRTHQGRLEEAAEMLETLATRLRRSGRHGNLNDTLFSLANCYAELGRCDDSRALFHHLSAEYALSESMIHLFWSSYLLAVLDRIDGEHQHALHSLRERLPLFAHINDARSEGYAHTGVGLIQLWLQRPGAAAEALSNAHAAFSRLPGANPFFLLLDTLLAEARGDTDALPALAKRADEADYQSGISEAVRCGLAQLHRQRGEMDEARQILHEAKRNKPPAPPLKHVARDRAPRA